MKKKFKNEDGQSVVELAITLPILLLVLCGIIDFGWIFLGQLSTNNCAREGARYAITNSTSYNLTTLTLNKIKQIAPENIKENISSNVTLSNPSNPRTGDVTVEVNSVVSTLTIVGNTIFNSNCANLYSKVTMKAE